MNLSDKALVVFQGKQIRRTWFNDEWWFSIVDVVGVLTQTDRSRKYWSDLKAKLQNEGFEPSEKIGQLKLKAEDGKSRLRIWRLPINCTRRDRWFAHFCLHMTT